MGAEAQLSRFKTRNGESQLAIFSYPTPQIAARAPGRPSRRFPALVVKRTGPLVAAIISPANADDAERLLAEVKYEPTITWTRRFRSLRERRNMLTGICILAGVLIDSSVLSDSS